jgi:hypothetical integral membrane protein (TIGR02206 family)
MNTQSFRLFSIEHLLTLLAIIIIDIILLAILRRAGSKRKNQIFGISLAVFIIILEIISNTWKVCNGKWALNTSLPLHLCGISLYISAVMLIRNSHSLYEVAYFWGLGGAVIALVTPNLDFTFPHIMYLKFFLAHNAIVIAVLYMTVIRRYRPVFKSVIRVFVITNIYMIITGIVNYFLDSNYLYICHKPGGITLLDFFGPWPYYIISMEAAGILIFYLLYLPFRCIKGRDGKILK